MEHLKNLKDGFCSLFSAIAEPRTYQVMQGGFLQDRTNLQNDVNRIAQSLSNNAEKAYNYGKTH